MDLILLYIAVLYIFFEFDTQVLYGQWKRCLYIRLYRNWRVQFWIKSHFMFIYSWKQCDCTDLWYRCNYLYPILIKGLILKKCDCNFTFDEHYRTKIHKLMFLYRNACERYSCGRQQNLSLTPPQKKKKKMATCRVKWIYILKGTILVWCK